MTLAVACGAQPPVTPAVNRRSHSTQHNRLGSRAFSCGGGGGGAMEPPTIWGVGLGKGLN